MTTGSTAARGYGALHVAERKRLAPIVATGTVDCARCGKRIRSTEPWDLGHDDNDRSVWTGPEHRACNRSAGGAVGRASQLGGYDPEPRPWNE